MVSTSPKDGYSHHKNECSSTLYKCWNERTTRCLHALNNSGAVRFVRFRLENTTTLIMSPKALRYEYGDYWIDTKLQSFRVLLGG
mmetsp:Transcript_18204/g.34775  ORF Transcript_18204/g.34775 Transcript_18204/m.34775 type:complete len:85 (+) Transcript_18204:593-847(+)